MISTSRFVLEDIAVPAADRDTLEGAVVIAGAIGWLLASYLGPIVSLVRSAFGGASRLVLPGLYIVLVLALAYVAALTANSEAAPRTSVTVSLADLLTSLVQPLRW